jgi:hypothetical protein
MLKRSVVLALAILILFKRPVLNAAQIEAKGALDAPADAALTVVSTDPVVQNVLAEDISAAKRGPAAGKKALTLTVTLNQRPLQPGVSLTDLSPGDPDIVSLLKAAGGEVPALADTGTTETDPYTRAAQVAAQQPQSSSIANTYSQSNPMRNLGAYDYAPRDYSPYANIPGSEIYDTAIVCHATISGSRGQLTTVAVLHPHEDVRALKKLIAERIANSLLH